jgi:hypothetical protein
VIAAALGTLAAASPILVVAGLLAAGAWRDRRRRARIARQVRLIDALGAELGLVVAPRVSKPLGRPWRVDVAVPVGRPAVVGRIVAITHDALTESGPTPYRLVLRPAASSGATGTPARGGPGWVRQSPGERRGARAARASEGPVRSCG